MDGPGPAHFDRNGNRDQSGGSRQAVLKLVRRGRKKSRNGETGIETVRREATGGGVQHPHRNPGRQTYEYERAQRSASR
jgi:hypothetical protein